MVSHNTTVGFAGEDFKKSLDNLQSILDAAQPLAIKLVPSKQLKTSITECIKTVQIFLCGAEDEYGELQDEIEEETKEQLSETQEKQEEFLRLKGKDKKERTQEEEDRLIELEKDLGIRD